MRSTVGMALLCLVGLCFDAEAAGELVLPIGGPVLRETGRLAGDPLCAAPALFLPDGKFVPTGLFENLAHALVRGDIETEGVEPDAAAFLTDDRLLRSSLHLARLRGLAEKFTDPGRWRIVSFRADFCPGSARGDASNAATCDDLFRLVAQPFELNGLFVRTPDAALHLSYLVPDRAEFNRMRRELDQADPAAGTQVAQALFDSDRFSCQSPALQRLSRLLDAMAQPDRLQAIAWMTSSASGQQWTFGRFTLNDQRIMVPQRIAGSGYFDNFSKPMLLSDKCPLNADASSAEKTAFHCPEASSEPPIKATELLERFDDPHDLRRPEQLCVSCHAAPVLRTLAHTHRVNDSLGLPVFSSVSVNLSNLRQFGYDLHGYRSLSERLKLIQKN